VLCKCVCVSVCMHVCIYVCTYVCICTAYFCICCILSFASQCIRWLPYHFCRIVISPTCLFVVTKWRLCCIMGDCNWSTRGASQLQWWRGGERQHARDFRRREEQKLKLKVQTQTTTSSLEQSQIKREHQFMLYICLFLFRSCSYGCADHWIVAPISHSKVT